MATSKTIFAIIVDSGSTDGGPYKLGMGKMTCGRGSYVRDLEPMLAACFHHKVKVLIGSAGGDGSNKHVAEMLNIVTEIAQRKGYNFKVATILAGMDRDWIKSRISQNRVGPCGPVEPLPPDAVDSAVDVVSQMGAEPYIEALKDNPDIIIGGRSYDPAPFAAFSIARGVLPDVAWHMGKIMECGGICAIPKGRSMIATMRKDSFDLTPLSPTERCTPLSVAAHTLYEKTRPDRLPGPGGVLNLDGAKYDQVTPKTCRVSGAKFERTPYQVKLEGIDSFLERVRVYSQNLFPELDKSEQCRLLYHVYGKNGVMGPLEPAQVTPHEIAVLGEVVAPTSELSHTIANNVLATTGNFASPLSPHEQDAGAVFKFSLYHLVDLDEGEEISIFPVQIQNVGCPDANPEPLAPISSETFAKTDIDELAPVVPKRVPTGEAPLSEIARIVRSKNSGPFAITFDVTFDDAAVYHRVKEANVFTNETIRSLYHITDKDILTNMYFEPALAWKCTIKRQWAQGSVGERDTLGTQQHAPLPSIRIPAAKQNVSNGTSDSVATKTNTKTGTNGTNTTDGGTTPKVNDYVKRDDFTAEQVVKEIWMGLDLPVEVLKTVILKNEGSPTLPSSYKMAILAQSSIALSTLAAAQIHALRNNTAVPAIDVLLEHATVEFKSERLYVLHGKPPPSP
ncbi:hypothetical protein CCHL11_02470 [Colletotrichum chlorophyti]|uniref:Caib baif family enzyme n=1 Tax=Colletotrichum chlorophyti TaxID=708187 RepID=A0A1Q8S945_9PEZI|nr:hypothetical protein CCHL11_02470 [Colletotrichum chlorophyti]